MTRGHRRIGFINLYPYREDNIRHDGSWGRLRGYKQALAEHGIQFDDALVKYTDIYSRVETNYQLTIELMQRSNPPTAIFCGKDQIASGCYSALRDLGLRIPDDVAVIGFDNLFELAEYLWPPLTTVQLPHYEMGKWAVEYLSQNNEFDKSPLQHTIDCPVVERKSV